MEHGEVIYMAVIKLNPITKKNSQQIRFKKIASEKALYRRQKEGFRLVGIPYIAQGNAYEEYEKQSGWFLIRRPAKPISEPVNIRVLFYRANELRCDLTNLLEAIDDILVKYAIIVDDNWKVLRGHDGSAVYLDREHPRTEVYIEKWDK